MELTPIYKRVIALDVHQAKITACAIVEHDDGRQEMTQLDFGAFRRDRRRNDGANARFSIVHLQRTSRHDH